MHIRVPTDFEEKRTALSGNFLYLQWPGLKNSRINAYRAGTQVQHLLEIVAAILASPVRVKY